MVVARISGGIGNQLFQYAAGSSLATLLNTQFFLDISFYTKNSNRSFELGKFNINAEVLDKKKLYSLFNKSKYYYLDLILGNNRIFEDKSILFSEREFSFNKEFFDLNDPIVLDGYWQSEKYFDRNRAVLLKEFTPVNIEKYNIHPVIKSERLGDGISLHIRRGDYQSNLEVKVIHGICSDDYYFNAVKFIRDKIGNKKIFIFSDDLMEANRMSSLIENSIVVSSITKQDPLMDLFLMMQCGHHIIANSTYSWWAAWLCTNIDKTVVAPLKWFNNSIISTLDLFPESWKLL